MTNTTPGQMSYSSASQVLGCPRRYFYRKIKKYDQDADAPDDLHFRFGKAYHHALEKCLHTPTQHHVSHVEEGCALNGLGKPEVIKISSMLISYFQLHLKSGLHCVGVELKVENDKLQGYIDAVMKDANGYWWIVDLKTSSRVKVEDLVKKLADDFQLNLYAAFADQVAEKFGLDPAKFMGCRYRTCQKPDLVVRDIDTADSYHKRNPQMCVDIEVPVSAMNPADAVKQAEIAYALSLDLAQRDEADVPKNTKDCMAYFKPCEYWSRCYGAPYTQRKHGGVQAWTSLNMVDRTFTPAPESDDLFGDLAEEPNFDIFGE